MSFFFRHTFGGRIDLRPCVSLCCFSFQNDCKVVEFLSHEHMTVGQCLDMTRFQGVRSSRPSRTFSRRSCGNGDFLGISSTPCLLLRACDTQVLERPNSLVLAPVSLGEYLRQRNGPTRVFLSEQLVCSTKLAVGMACGRSLPSDVPPLVW